MENINLENNNIKTSNNKTYFDASFYQVSVGHVKESALQNCNVSHPCEEKNRYLQTT